MFELIDPIFVIIFCVIGSIAVNVIVLLLDDDLTVYPSLVLFKESTLI